MKERSGNHWLVWLAMCGMIGATLGVKNTSGVFFTPMAESFGVGRGAISLTLTLSNLLLAAGDFFSTRLYTGGNFRRLTRLCVACAVGATLLMGMVSDLWLLYLLHFVRGFASGIYGMISSRRSYMIGLGSPTESPPIPYPGKSISASAFALSIRRSVKNAPCTMPNNA